MKILKQEVYFPIIIGIHFIFWAIDLYFYKGSFMEVSSDTLLFGEMNNESWKKRTPYLGRGIFFLGGYRICLQLSDGDPFKMGRNASLVDWTRCTSFIEDRVSLQFFSCWPTLSLCQGIWSSSIRVSLSASMPLY